MTRVDFLRSTASAGSLFEPPQATMALRHHAVCKNTRPSLLRGTGRAFAGSSAASVSDCATVEQLRGERSPHTFALRKAGRVLILMTGLFLFGRALPMCVVCKRLPVRSDPRLGLPRSSPCSGCTFKTS